MIRKLLLVGLLIVGGGVATASDDAIPDASPATTVPPDVPVVLTPGLVLQEFPTGGPRNQVFLRNNKDESFMARSAIALNHSNTPNVQPMNVAIAEGRCTDCVTMAIALQVFLYKRGAPSVTPQNIALAMNVECTRCVTIARAIQYVIPVDDPNAVPDEVRALMREMETELRYFATVKTVGELDPDEANARLTRFTEQNTQLRQYLFDLMDRESDASPRAASPSPASPSPASPSPTGAPASSSPTVAPSPSDSPPPSEPPTPTPTTP